MDTATFARAAGISMDLARRWAGSMTSAMAERGINTPRRQAAFIAQTAHESGGFVHVREIWGPTPQQQRYEGRADLGNTQPGDGSRYRGRGPIQITGRANYRAVGKALGFDLEAFPQLLEGAELGARAAAWFWHTHGLNELADVDDFASITRRINGGLKGIDDRRRRWEIARSTLGVK
jgi:putative chitinase